MIHHMKEAYIKKNLEFLCDFLQRLIDGTDLIADSKVYIEESKFLNEDINNPDFYFVRAKFTINDLNNTVPNCTKFTNQLMRLTNKNFIMCGTSSETAADHSYRTIGLSFSRQTLDNESVENVIRSKEGLNKFCL